MKLTPESLKANRCEMIELAIENALSPEGRHWDLLYQGVEGVRPDTDVPYSSWNQLPMLAVVLGERLNSRKSILEHERAGWLSMQIATDLIWISGFALIGSEIENRPKFIAPHLRQHLLESSFDTDAFDAELIKAHNQWCYCARMIWSEDDPAPLYLSDAAEATLKIAALVLDLAVEQKLLPDPTVTS